MEKIRLFCPCLQRKYSKILLLKPKNKTFFSNKKHLLGLNSIFFHFVLSSITQELFWSSKSSLPWSASIIAKKSPNMTSWTACNCYFLFDFPETYSQFTIARDIRSPTGSKLARIDHICLSYSQDHPHKTHLTFWTVYILQFWFDILELINNS